MPGPEGLSESYKRQLEDAKLGRDQIAKALAQAQGSYTIAEKDAKGNFGDKKYASLPSVWEACIPSLSSNNIAVISYTYWSIVSVPYDEGEIENPKDKDPRVKSVVSEKGFMQIFIVVELVHGESGQKFSSELPVIPERQLNRYGKRIRSEMQDISAAKSLAKRQLFIDLAFANVAEEDHDSIPRSQDNGNGNEGKSQQSQPQRSEAKEAFVSDLKTLSAQFKAADKEKEMMGIVNDLGFETLKGITDEDSMAKILIALKEVAEKLPKPKKEETTKSAKEEE